MLQVKPTTLFVPGAWRTTASYQFPRSSWLHHKNGSTRICRRPTSSTVAPYLQPELRLLTLSLLGEINVSTCGYQSSEYTFPAEVSPAPSLSWRQFASPTQSPTLFIVPK